MTAAVVTAAVAKAAAVKAAVKAKVVAVVVKEEMGVVAVVQAGCNTPLHPHCVHSYYSPNRCGCNGKDSAQCHPTLGSYSNLYIYMR